MLKERKIIKTSWDILSSVYDLFKVGRVKGKCVANAAYSLRTSKVTKFVVPD